MNNYTTRPSWWWQSGIYYKYDVDKDYFIASNSGYSIMFANFRPIIEYRE